MRNARTIASKLERRPWQGTEWIEKQANLLHNRLVAVILYGVEGGPANSRGNAPVPSSKADQYIAEGRTALHDWEAQRAPTASSRRWHEYKVKDLRRKLEEAEAVRAGHQVPKL
jgi:hypothetical protein